MDASVNSGFTRLLVSEQIEDAQKGKILTFPGFGTASPIDRSWQKEKLKAVPGKGLSRYALSMLAQAPATATQNEAGLYVNPDVQALKPRPLRGVGHLPAGSRDKTQIRERGSTFRVNTSGRNGLNMTMQCKWGASTTAGAHFHLAILVEVARADESCSRCFGLSGAGRDASGQRLMRHLCFGRRHGT